MDALVDLQGTDIFGLGTGFNTQSSTTDTGEQNVPTNDSSGNVACQRNITQQTDYTQTATYCEDTPNFMTAIGTFLTKFGDVQNDKLVTSLTINMTSGEYVSIDIAGHNHEVNPHVSGLGVGYADVSDFLPHETGESFMNWDGFGVPDFGVTLGTAATPSSATVTFSFGGHPEKNDPDGDHFVGKNITPRCELSMDFEGIPTSNTLAAIEIDLNGNLNRMLVPLADTISFGDSNADFDTFSFTAHSNPALTTI